jgi:transcriptional regulator with PAS, ATPase and Fis domain/tetratricopeptide (TPR) repeat protein
VSSTVSELARLESRLSQALAEGVSGALGEPELAQLEWRLGVLHGRSGDLDQALAHLSAARRRLATLRDARKLAALDAALGQASAHKGEHERAATFLARAAAAATELGDVDLDARVSTQLGELALRRGEPARAQPRYEDARRHFEKYWDGAELATIYGGLAVIAGALADHEQADRLSEKALEDAEASGDPLVIGRALLRRAHVRQLAGDTRAARRCFRRAIHVLGDHELRRDLAEAYLAYGTFAASQGQEGEIPDGFTDPPAYWLAKAQALFRELGGLGDLERVREAFRRHGRRATDRVAGVEVLRLLEELKQNRVVVQRESRRLIDRATASLDELGAHAPPERGPLVARARDEVHEAERALAHGVGELALAEERFLGALNTVILERENIRTLLELTRSLSLIHDYARLPGDIAKMAAQLTGADRALVALVGDDGKPRVRGAVRLKEDDDGPWRQAIDAAVRPSGGAALLAAPAADERVVADDGEAPRARGARASERAPSEPHAPAGMRLGVALACPLRHGDKVFGAIYADKELCGGVFAERDLDLLSIFAAQVATILENGRVAEELRLAARTRAATLEAISDGVLKLVASGVVTSINAAAMRMLGVSAGADLRSLRLASFPDLAFLGGCMARGEEFDGRLVRLSSGDHLANGRVVRTESGEIEGMVVTLTEMKRATSLAQRIVGMAARFTFADIVGGSPLLRRRLQLAEAAARSDSNVLVTGESGTGKELLAQAIHNAGPRSGGPFVGINCAAIPRELLESELFGYEAGAFTGAKRGGHPGKFELAEGGTILLDEIGDMPLEMQAKLLRVLQEKRVQRLGGTKEIPLDTRVIATTNRDLGEDAARGRFRQDLFFRLRVIHVELPPLRARPDDIPVLVDHFLELFSARLGKQVRGVAPHVLDVLVSYAWPGNVRELEHVLEGEINLATPAQELLTEVPIMLESAPPSSFAEGSLDGSFPPPRATPVPLRSGEGGLLSLEENEKQLLLAALAQHHGSVPEVARALGVSRGTVYNKMRKFQIDPDAYRSA